MSSVLASGFLTTESPEKPYYISFLSENRFIERDTHYIGRMWYISKDESGLLYFLDSMYK